MAVKATVAIVLGNEKDSNLLHHFQELLPGILQVNAHFRICCICFSCVSFWRCIYIKLYFHHKSLTVSCSDDDLSASTVVINV